MNLTSQELADLADAMLPPDEADRLIVDAYCGSQCADEPGSVLADLQAIRIAFPRMTYTGPVTPTTLITGGTSASEANPSRRHTCLWPSS